MHKILHSPFRTSKETFGSVCEIVAVFTINNCVNKRTSFNIPDFYGKSITDSNRFTINRSICVIYRIYTFFSFHNLFSHFSIIIKYHRITFCGKNKFFLSSITPAFFIKFFPSFKINHSYLYITWIFLSKIIVNIPTHFHRSHNH